jgi:holo-[acyl-carrier protein] synthase
MLAVLGADISRVDRMRPSLDLAPFMRRTFTDGEMTRAQGQPDQAVYYAKLFAAKEAIFKSFAISADELRSWLEIEIIESQEFAPAAELSGSMQALASERGVERVLVSLSGETNYVVAIAATAQQSPVPRSTVAKPRRGSPSGLSVPEVT